MTDSLGQTLLDEASSLSQPVLDRMYENPFWLERYGERGRRFAHEDAHHHLDYLAQALAADDPELFERYAVWLRTILVSRGMCSEHLAEHFRRLAEAIDGRDYPGKGRATGILARGSDALRYTAGPAEPLEAARDSLHALVDVDPEAATMREDDRRYLVSYLLDAVATGDPAGFDGFAARCPPPVVGALCRIAVRLGAPLPARPPADGGR